MPIHVICPGCHARFSVGDQHAGKSGACPKCKGPIQIPAVKDEVIIHAPEMEAGAKDAKGRNVLKPIRRKETKFNLNTALVAGGGVILTVAIAFLVGNQKQEFSAATLTYILAGGAALLGPPLAYAGYSFLRDDELGSFVGKDLLIRCAACGLVYALLWGVYWYLGYQFFGDDYANGNLEFMYVGILAGVALALGTGTAFVSFDFEPITGFFHFTLFFVSTILLRGVMGLSLLPGLGSVS